MSQFRRFGQVRPSLAVRNGSSCPNNLCVVGAQCLFSHHFVLLSIILSTLVIRPVTWLIDLICKWY